MKLVDLDKIEYFTLVDKWGIPRYKIKIGDGLPIVKAIPIKFIEEQIAKTTDISNSDELDVLYAGNLNYLLKLWEAENGKE